LEFGVGAVGKQKISELARRTRSCRKNERSRGDIFLGQRQRFSDAARTTRRAWAAWLGQSDLHPAEASAWMFPRVVCPSVTRLTTLSTPLG
jgi:hypothetical protein